MATLLLTAVATATAGLFGPVGGPLVQAAAGLAGAVVDRSLFGGRSNREIGRLADLDVQSSSEGAPIPRVFGRVRIAGEIIWATRFEEVGQSTRSGGKGGGARSTVTTFSYFANFAVALCEGPIARVGRVWANGELVDITALTMRVHTGTQDQSADSLILAKQGDAPAYRGLAYVVFERLPLERFGNAIPQLTFEVIRPVGRLERMIGAVTLIPAATEFGYATTPVRAETGEGVSTSENRRASTAASDLDASLDELTALCPNLRSVALVVTWFGDDLRAETCRVRPMVEHAEKATTGLAWSVAGLDRGSAAAVSRIAGRPATGGTPSDASVVEAIRALKARGLKVTFYPFLMMDLPPGNGRPDPYGAAEQAAFPWRGRITCHPAPGRPASPDGGPAAATTVASFLGDAARGDFTVGDGTVAYAGPQDWGYRRMILHYAALSAAAGGVDCFLVGSELRGLTWIRGAGGTYPFVEGLRALAADAKAMLGATTEVSYAADWTEWFGHRPPDGSLAFHLDPLWADPNIDFVGIDAYVPLTDWRPGDAPDASPAKGPRDRSHLLANVTRGEGYDWFYASDADRAARRRSPIVDGAAGKPWVFRNKDFAGWWSNLHIARAPSGAEIGGPSAWRPGLKPLRFTEIGCPAVDLGANEPNVFPDRLSSEGRAPRFSRGTRDDAVQRRAVEAMLRRFDPEDPAFDPAVNPLSPLDGRRMLDPATSHVWTWDARPFPWFPLATDFWSDGENWRTGHWLNGRLGAAPLDDLIKALGAGLGVGLETDDLSPVIDGYIVSDRASLREAIEPLARLFRFHVAEAATGLRLEDRSSRLAATLSRGDLAETDRDPVLSIRRAQAEDLPGEVAIGFLDTEADGRQASVVARRIGPPRVLDLAVPATAAAGVMQGVADALLKDMEAGRETVTFALPPTALALEPGDLVRLVLETRAVDLLVERIEDAELRRVEARTVDRLAEALSAETAPHRAPPAVSAVGPPLVVVIDTATGEGEAPWRPFLAAAADPWPGTLAVHRRSGGGYETVATLTQPATIGRLQGALGPGRTGLFDRANVMEVVLTRGLLSAADRLAVFDGRNLAAVGDPGSGWELIQFERAELVGRQRYRLTGLLRGQGGTEWRMAEGHAPGARFVLLDGAAIRLPIARDQIGRPLTLRIGPAGRDVGDPATTEITVTPAGVGLRPYAPARLTARRLADGDVAVAWTRRTRSGGDDFDAVEVPLGESLERYAVVVRNGSAVLRRAETAAPAWVYTAAEQTADFGALPERLDIAVAQIAEAIGAGPDCRRILDV